MNKLTVLVIAAIAGAAIVFSINGCSLVGLGIGTAVDRARPDKFEELTGWEIEAIKPGDTILIQKINGDSLTGEFGGLDPISFDKYTAKYSKCRDLHSGEFNLPLLGDTIIAVDTSGNNWEIEFMGFDASSLLFRKRDFSEPGRVTLTRISKIIIDGKYEISGSTLNTMTLGHQIPSYYSLILDGNFRRHIIPIDDIYSIGTRTSKHGGRNGFLVGAAIDIIIIAVFILTDEDPPPPSPPPAPGAGDIMCGCPFIYSFDGERFVLDSEGFGGSIFKAAERPDWDRLDYLADTDGICRIKYADMLQETDFIDEVKLIAIDHPPDIEVLPSFAGDLYSIAKPTPPESAVDLGGANIMRMVEKSDSLYWISNQFARDPDQMGQARDGIILEFPRPADADMVKLLFNVKNTRWAALMQSEFLRMHGEKLDDWYELMNSSESERDKLLEAFVREGMLLIDLWYAGEWRQSGFIWEVGTSTFREQVVCLDIINISGDVLKIKLESTSGFWMINSVFADYSPNITINTTEISPTKALDQKGENILSALLDADERYHTMIIYDWAELEFNVPPRKKNLKRTYIIKSTGYYNINVPTSGDPKNELVEKYVTEPGAFGRYAVRRFNDIAVGGMDHSQH
ncbi:MAG: hypothetical protein V3W18_10920 [candidate division Zixibacteria bacterium]